MSGLHRRDVLKTAFAARGDALAISGLGSATWDLASLGDRDDNFYLWGAMGNAAMIGLGLARARPDKRVVVVTGDGDPYRYLVESIQKFPAPQIFEHMIAEAGFVRTSHRMLTGGIVAIHSGWKI